MKPYATRSRHTTTTRGSNEARIASSIASAPPLPNHNQLSQAFSNPQHCSALLPKNPYLNGSKLCSLAPRLKTFPIAETAAEIPDHLRKHGFTAFLEGSESDAQLISHYFWLGVFSNFESNELGLAEQLAHELGFDSVYDALNDRETWVLETQENVCGVPTSIAQAIARLASVNSGGHFQFPRCVRKGESRRMWLRRMVQFGWVDDDVAIKMEELLNAHEKGMIAVSKKLARNIGEKCFSKYHVCGEDFLISLGRDGGLQSKNGQQTNASTSGVDISVEQSKHQDGQRSTQVSCIWACCTSNSPTSFTNVEYPTSKPGKLDFSQGCSIYAGSDGIALSGPKANDFATVRYWMAPLIGIRILSENELEASSNYLDVVRPGNKLYFTGTATHGGRNLDPHGHMHLPENWTLIRLNHFLAVSPGDPEKQFFEMTSELQTRSIHAAALLYGYAHPVYLFEHALLYDLEESTNITPSDRNLKKAIQLLIQALDQESIPLRSTEAFEWLENHFVTLIAQVFGLSQAHSETKLDYETRVLLRWKRDMDWPDDGQQVFRFGCK
ncbi:hypothetical protein HDU78_004372 [Chytriomyces hyalinus]|nr:hypothetical protein HDU78_004372 [Chytriomyces hyalinus]